MEDTQFSPRGSRVQYAARRITTDVHQYTVSILRVCPFSDLFNSFSTDYLSAEQILTVISEDAKSLKFFVSFFVSVLRCDWLLREESQHLSSKATDTTTSGFKASFFC